MTIAAERPEIRIEDIIRAITISEMCHYFGGLGAVYPENILSGLTQHPIKHCQKVYAESVRRGECKISGYFNPED